MRIGLVGPSYTARSTAVADEETINWYIETVESQGAVVPSKSYGGSTAKSVAAMFGTPGLLAFLSSAPPNAGPVRGMIAAKLSPNDAVDNAWAVIGSQFGVVNSGGHFTAVGTVISDGQPVSMALNSFQILIVGAGHAYCYTISTATLLDVTTLLAGTPIQCQQSDGYFIVTFLDTNKFQMSQILDGTTWPGLLVNEVNVFPENIQSIIVNHRELWVMGSQHIQPYQNTGSAEVFDVIPGTLIEKGCAATFCPARLDNSVFWIDEDERGGRSAWRSNGYTPQRISTHAVETDLETYNTAQIATMTTYSYQDAGHIFWVLYIPASQWSWVYDVVEGLWHKRSSWNTVTGQAGPHFSQNHVYAYGKHLVGDWNSGNVWDMSMSYYDDNGTAIQRLRRSPTIIDEKKRIFHRGITLDFDTGLGPQPPLTDGNGNPRPPQVMLRWSDNRGKTWSNQHVAGCGMSGQYNTRVIFRRLGQSRGRVYEISVSDPIPWSLVDGYLVAEPSQ
jgi:hypothetical protein